MPARSAAVFLTGLLTALAAAALEVRTYTASELGFLANSHLLLGEAEALLVDAQFTRSEARDVAEMIEDSGRELTAIFITSARPEHHLGLEVLAASFPEARILARPSTVARIRQEGGDAITMWQPIYLDDMPSRPVVPEAFTGDRLALDGAEIRLVDAAGATALHLPADAALLTGDTVLSGVHPWLAGVDLGAWLADLETLRALAPVERVYPGHGEPGDAGLIGETERYVSTLRAALAGGVDDARLLRAMIAAYPDHRLPVLLERSVRSLERAR